MHDFLLWTICGVIIVIQLTVLRKTRKKAKLFSTSHVGFSTSYSKVSPNAVSLEKIGKAFVLKRCSLVKFSRKFLFYFPIPTATCLLLNGAPLAMFVPSRSLMLHHCTKIAERIGDVEGFNAVDVNQCKLESTWCHLFGLKQTFNLLLSGHRQEVAFLRHRKIDFTTRRSNLSTPPFILDPLD